MANRPGLALGSGQGDCDVSKHRLVIQPVNPFVLRLIWEGEHVRRFVDAQELVVELAKVFNKANYDDIVAEGLGPVQSALIARERGWLNPLVPLRYLQASSVGATTGVCRHSASAMAGLLVELGYSPKDIGLFATKNHVYIKVRVGDEMVVVDPTPGASDTKAADYADDPVWMNLRPVQYTAPNFSLDPGRTLPSSFFDK